MTYVGKTRRHVKQLTDPRILDPHPNEKTNLDTNLGISQSKRRTKIFGFRDEVFFLKFWMNDGIHLYFHFVSILITQKLPTTTTSR